MRFSRKMAATVTAGVMTAAMAAAMVGCSSSGSSAEAVKSITVWHNAADTSAIQNLYKNFTSKTGIKVELVSIPADGFETAVQTKWATGDRPDILEYHPTTASAAQLNAAENMQDLSDMDFVKKSGDLYKAAGSLKGKVYAAITGMPSIFGVFYNKSVFQKAGVAVPKTFDDLLASCAPLKAAGVAPFYESGQSLWPTQILPALYVADQNKNGDYSQALRTNKKPVNDPNGPLVKSLQVYEKVRDNCFQSDASTGTFEKGISEVYSGQAAMVALHSDTYNLWLDAAKGDDKTLSDTVGFAGVSSKSPTAWYGPGPLGSYYAPKTGDASREQAARSFVQYATGDGYKQLVEDGKSFPVISGVDTPQGISPLKKEFKAAYDGGATIGFGTDVIGWDPFSKEMGKLLNKQATPQQVADNMKANVEQASTAAGVEGW